MQMRILRRVLARVPNAVDIVAYGHMGVCQRSMSPGTRLHAGLDFASFGADLGAAQAAALQFYEAQGAADANRRAVQAAISVGTLLNGAGRSLVHLTVNALYIKCCLCMGCPLLCPQVSASFPATEEATRGVHEERATAAVPVRHVEVYAMCAHCKKLLEAE